MDWNGFAFEYTEHRNKKEINEIVEKAESVGISSQLLKDVLESLVGIALSGYFIFHPTLGFSCSVVTKEQDMLVDCKISTSYFEWYNLNDKKEIKIPVFFDLLLNYLEKFKKSEQDEMVEFFPQVMYRNKLECCALQVIQGISSIEDKKDKNTSLEIQFFQTNPILFDVIAPNVDIFPQMNSGSLLIDRVEFLRQLCSHFVEIIPAAFSSLQYSGLYDQQYIYLFMMDRYFGCFSQKDGQFMSFIPCIKQETTYTTSGCSIDKTKRKNDEEKMYQDTIMKNKLIIPQWIQDKKNYDLSPTIQHECLVQKHLFRRVREAFKNKSTPQNIALAMSEKFGLVCHFPLPCYGLISIEKSSKVYIDRVQKIPNIAYIEYRFPSMPVLVPLPFYLFQELSTVALKRGLAPQKIIKDKKVNRQYDILTCHCPNNKVGEINN